MKRRFGMRVRVIGVLAVLAVLLALGSCSPRKSFKPAADREAAERAVPVAVGYSALNETEAWFEFQFDHLTPVQNAGAFNAFLFSWLDPNTEMLWAEGWVMDPGAVTGHKIPGITHRAGFDTYGES
ncbi:MAG: hypothetical protein LBL45_03970, partial [Treponema sp.]|nr:hypothetical protein [Treponema sp.]